MTNELIFSKGTYSVTIYSSSVAEGYTNKIFLIAAPQSQANQADGRKTVKVVDLLRITHDIVVKGYVVGTSTKTAKEIKDELVSIFNGGGTNGGVVSLIYNGTTYSGYLEKLTITEESFDEPDDFVTSKENYDDVVQYEVAVTFNEGEAV